MRRPAEFNLRRSLLLAAGVGAALVYALVRPAPNPPHALWQGPTMGTTYRVILPHCPLRTARIAALRVRMEDRLRDLNRQMSTYDPTSEISQFNRWTEDAPFPVSADFAAVVRLARALHVATHGAFDPTLAPLIDLWGFGAPETGDAIPSPAAIREALARVDGLAIEVSDTPGGMAALQRSRPGVTLNLSAVAKGYAVDVLADLAREAGLRDFYVEIGGEIVVEGHNRERRPWELGLESPQYELLADAAPLLGRIERTSGAIAGSGDYRNFFLHEGRRYSHILDPRTGAPVTHGIAATTVLADTCGMADGLATALLVLDPADGMALIERLARVEALLVRPDGRGGFELLASSGFPLYRSGLPPAGWVPSR